MADAWLPSAASARRSPPYQRPPAISLQPAVALPLFPAAALAVALIWAAGRSFTAPGQMPASAPSPPAEVQIQPPMPLPGPVGAWAAEIDRWSEVHGLPTDLVAVVMTIESCGHPTAVSRAGALGLFQVMPFHFATGETALDPEVNARRGLAYLRRALEISGGDEALALAGYNGGHGLIARPRASWPDETVRYVAWGTGILRDMRSGRSPSPTLQAWLDAGGAYLCRRAEAGS